MGKRRVTWQDIDVVMASLCILPVGAAWIAYLIESEEGK